jgi:hypothetical protein
MKDAGSSAGRFRATKMSLASLSRELTTIFKILFVLLLVHVSTKRPARAARYHIMA